MRRPGRRSFGVFIALALLYIIVTGIVVHLSGTANKDEVLEEREWVASGKYWLDRQVCRWLGVCGTMHMILKSRWTWPTPENGTVGALGRVDFWTSNDENPDDWSKEERKLREIPQFVLDHAPYVHLFSGEEFWPGDLAEHLEHSSPFLNYTRINDLDRDQTTTNLHELNDYEGAQHGRFMYLQSNENVEEWPDWLSGRHNIPVRPKKQRENPDDDEEDATWPSLDDLKDFDLESAKQNALAQAESDKQNVQTTVAYEDLVPSTDGRCGGNTGFTCKGSKFGQCCSIYGWCGRSDAFCGASCDPLCGVCTLDPLHPQGPHRDLRRRGLDDFHHSENRPEEGGRSGAPAFLIVVPKDDGIVDAFWFFFYSFNLGQKVLKIRFGNHVGDWEHTVVRFRNGKPQEIFLSEHDFGEAYTWAAIEKYIPGHDGSGTMIGSWSNHTAAKLATRPVIYSATGSHAMYGTPGLHPYVLPWGMLHDETDRGPLWDPAQNLRAYTYDARERVLRASTLNPRAPTGWFYFTGHWGDKYYALSDPRQYRLAGQYHYVNGPLGPRFKNLARRRVCQGHGDCVVRNWIGDPTIPIGNPPEEDVEDGGLPGGNVTDDAI